MRRHRAVVMALCEAIVADRCGGQGRGRQDLQRQGPLAGAADQRHEAVVRFVLAQQQRMPDYLHGPVRMLTLAFDWCGLGHGGRPFHRLEPAARRRQLRAWRQAPLRLCRDFVRLYESLVVFAWYAQAHDGSVFPRPGDLPASETPV